MQFVIKMALSQSHVPRYLGATPPEEAMPPPGGSHAPPPPRRKPRPPDIFSFDQRTKNPRSAPDVSVMKMDTIYTRGRLYKKVIKVNYD